MRGGLFRSVLPAVGVLVAAAPATADQIITGSTVLQRIRIVDLDGARVAYRTSAGALQHVMIADVDRMYVDSVSTLSAFNEGEKFLAQDNAVRALTHYARAQRLATDFWKTLVRARTIQAADRADRIDTLATEFVALLRGETASPELASELLPDRAPTADGKRVVRALATINGVIDDVPSQSARVLLEMLRFVIADRSDRPSAGGLAAELVRQPIPPLVASLDAYRVKTQALARWARETDPAEALREINLDVRTAPRDVLPELLLTKAHVLREAADDDEALTRSAWAAMRVVIHFRDHDKVPEALLFTAEVYERLGRNATALKLLDECVGHRRITGELRSRAAAMIDRLKSAG